MHPQTVRRAAARKGGTEMKLQREVTAAALALLAGGRLAQERRLLQHGRVTVLEHSAAVAWMSLAIAGWLHLRVDRAALVRGALLHDYFLYDWHESGHAWHGFTHPRTALQNAAQDYDLTPTERDIILRHMFPLTPIPPATAEGLLVCLSDKICAVIETFGLLEYKMPGLSQCREGTAARDTEKP